MMIVIVRNDESYAFKVDLPVWNSFQLISYCNVFYIRM